MKDLRDQKADGTDLKNSLSDPANLKPVRENYYAEPAQSVDQNSGLFLSPNNDTGNAEWFVERWDDSVRFVHGPQTWLIKNTDNALWERSARGEIIELAKELSREAIHQVAEIKDEHRRSAGSKRALAMGSSRKIDFMLKLAASDPKIALSANDVDSDPWLVGLENGVFDLKNGKLIDSGEKSFVTRQLGTTFDPGARCPAWLGFLERITDGNYELAHFLQCAIGYSLTAFTTEQSFFFLYGDGKNGKSTFTETIFKLLGGYAIRADERLLILARNGSYPGASVARLPGRRLLMASELGEGQKLNENLVKDLTGGDTITGEAKYCDPFDFKPICKLWMYGNHKPIISGTDHGIWRRVRLVPFSVTIPENETDPQLPGKLAEELPGILNWALAGLAEWRQADSLPTPSCVMVATEEYRSDQDILGEFISDCLVEKADATIRKAEVYHAYTEWAAREGYKYPLPNKKFTRRLKGRGFTESSQKYWHGWTTPREA